MNTNKSSSFILTRHPQQMTTIWSTYPEAKEFPDWDCMDLTTILDMHSPSLQVYVRLLANALRYSWPPYWEQIIFLHNLRIGLKTGSPHGKLIM